MKTVLLIISLLFLNICAQSQDQSARRHSISDFEKTITPQMGYDTIISRFGVPDINTGSGIYILIYNLVDSTSIVIGCDNTRILYARSRDRNGVVRDIIPLNQTEPNKKKLRIKSLSITGLYMQLASAPRESSGQNERASMAVQAAPEPPGAPADVTVFANARIK